MYIRERKLIHHNRRNAAPLIPNNDDHSKYYHSNKNKWDLPAIAHTYGKQSKPDESKQSDPNVQQKPQPKQSKNFSCINFLMEFIHISKFCTEALFQFIINLLSYGMPLSFGKIS